MRILLFRLSSLGDIVLQTPVASWLKWHFPNCHITFVTAEEFTSLLQGHPHIDQVIGMQRFRGKGAIKKLFQFCRQTIKEQKIDLIIDLHGNTRGMLLRLFNPSVPSLVLDKRKFARNLLVSTKINLLADTSSIHWRQLEDFSFLAPTLATRDDFVRFMQQQNSALQATSLPGAFKTSDSPIQGKYIVISAVASFAPKRWPVQKFYSLIESMMIHPHFAEYKAVILGGKSDEYLLPLESLVQKNPDRVYYLQGKTSLVETIEYLKHCQLCVGNDTGLGHIAEAMGRPALTIFGPTHPDFGFGVHLPASKNIRVDVKCSPCSTLGNKPCKYQTQFCMENLEVKSVLGQMIKATRV